MTALPILSEHARYKVWVKANGEMRKQYFHTGSLLSIQDLGDYGCTESRQNVKVVSAAPNTAPTLLHLIVYLNYGANLLGQLSYTVATL
jgi:hypothetical protein